MRHVPHQRNAKILSEGLIMCGFTDWITLIGYERLGSGWLETIPFKTLGQVTWKGIA